jgi:hypothetical protein
MEQRQQQPVDPQSLTTEPLSFNRQTGLSPTVPQLSLENWDVDPDLVKERLKSMPARVTDE